MPIVSLSINGKPLSIETGTLARQASGAVVVRYGDTIVLVTAAQSNQPREGVDFFPLTVDFEEKMWAAGKIPGSRFIKREGRPTEKAVVTCRRIDRPIRPLFPPGSRREVQVIATVLSADPWNLPDIPAMMGASAALTISAIPFAGPIAAVRVAHVNGQFVLNPTYQDVDAADLDLVIAGTEKEIMMIEADARQVAEAEVLKAVEAAQPALASLIEMQHELGRLAGREKLPVAASDPDPALGAALEPFAEQVRQAMLHPDKVQRESATQEIENEISQALQPSFPEREQELVHAIHRFVEAVFERLVLEENKRPDGRALDEIRQVSCHVALLPQTHGSALFSRGQTQVLSTVTLGGVGEAQILDTMTAEEETKRFIHHYNFPPFSVGEVKPLRGPGRREIGHSILVERALLPLVPDESVFPYTIRVVSEVLESNGSSSMASVCAGSLALMDAGVPMSAAAAGISIGMVRDGDRRALLTDIQGIEDFAGGMDLKVAGTRKGITAIQLDVKDRGIDLGILAEGLERARAARHAILDEMDKSLSSPRPELAPHAPRVFTIVIHPDKIGDLIGPGGKVIKKLEADFSVRIDIEQDGRVFVAAADQKTGEQAMKTIEDLTRELRIGETYVGKVVRITPFGAFVELTPGRDGLLHISQIAPERIERVEDVLNMGDEVMVKILEIDPAGKVRLTRKGLLDSGPSRK
jgi:polyribonucleotide nucleotidyltransferase